MVTQLIIGFLFASLIASISFRLKLLTRSGALAQFVLGIVLLGLGGWKWTTPMLAFFLLSNLVGGLGKEKKKDLDETFDKSSTRDAGQVFANGGVAGILVFFHLFMPHPLWFVAYLGAVAAVASDTLGTEIGTVSSSQPRLITTLRKVDRGRSGGVTALGLIAGACGAVVVWLAALYWMAPEGDGTGILAIVAAGIAGSVADSILGATVQLQFRCPSCSAIVEKSYHCGLRASKVHGLPFLSNDVVNIVCSIAGAGVATFIATLS